jgi:hypothetical protein
MVGVLVSCVTNKGYTFIPNIINNFKRQRHQTKKLIVVFNCKIEEQVKEKFKDLDCEVYIMPEKTQWDCHNFTVTKIPETFQVWAKMDDDDYYGKNYLLLNLKTMLLSGSFVVGRSDYYVYLPDSDRLYIRRGHGTNTRVQHIAGPTIFVNKKVFKKVSFDKVKSGGDVKFLNKCKRSGYWICSSGLEDFIYIRRQNNKNHTWKVDLRKYLFGARRINSKFFSDKKIHKFY